MMSPEWLEAAARRSALEDWTLGHVFERYRRLEGRTHEELAAELGCTRETLQWLSLSRRPTGEAFTDQVFVLSKRFAVDELRLIAVLRRVEVMDALAARVEGEEATDGEEPLQLAARDRPQDEETSS